MPAEKPWKIPRELQPEAGHYAFDLDRAMSSVVALKSTVPEDAFTAGSLGTERAGHAVQIRDSGLFLTIGYLVVEAEDVWLRTNEGRMVQGHALSYDQESGLGLVQALSATGIPSIPLGRSKDLSVGDRVVTCGAGGRASAVAARIVARQEFAGYWEYLLDEALFVAPAHPNWGGAAVLDEDGALIGIGSLQLESPQGKGDSSHLNMVVPIDLLEPIFDDLVKHGRRNKPARPWLGIYAADVEEKVVVAGTSDEGPAEKAGLAGGDIVLAVGGRRVKSLSDFWRTVWGLGHAGVQVPMLVFRDGQTFECRIDSVDRALFTKGHVLH